MGSPGIGKIVKKYGLGGISKKKYNDYEGNSVVIDLLHWLYKFKISMVNSNNDKNISHIKGLWDKTLNMLTFGILPIFVLDGKPPDIKKKTLKKRRKNRQIAKVKLNKVTNKEEKIKLLKRGVAITDNEIQETKELLSLLGIPLIEALGEADPQCAGINLARMAYGVVSDDWDLLTFGSNIMITNFGRRGDVIEYDLKKILNSLNLSYEQFVELAIVLGCDYCDPITCYFSKKSEEKYELYKKYKHAGSIENLIELLKRENLNSSRDDNKLLYKISDNFIRNWKSVKNYFLEPKINDPRNNFDFIWKKPDYCGLENILVNKYQFEHEIIKKTLNKLKNIYKYYSSYRTIKNFKKMRNNAKLCKSKISELRQ